MPVTVTLSVGDTLELAVHFLDHEGNEIEHEEEEEGEHEEGELEVSGSNASIAIVEVEHEEEGNPINSKNYQTRKNCR